MSPTSYLAAPPRISTTNIPQAVERVNPPGRFPGLDGTRPSARSYESLEGGGRLPAGGQGGRRSHRRGRAPGNPGGIRGTHGTWRSPVAHLNGVQGVAGSNPAVPIFRGPHRRQAMGPWCSPGSLAGRQLRGKGLMKGHTLTEASVYVSPCTDLPRHARGSLPASANRRAPRAHVGAQRLLVESHLREQEG